MRTLHGELAKMRTAATTPVAYTLPVGGEGLALNGLLGSRLRIRSQGEICCVACGRKTKKSFQQGHCYPCSQSLASCDICIVKPELCHYAAGTCRQPDWGLAHCMQPHYVYLANSSGLKVGITRASQIPTRWLDQGAVQALPVFRVASRYLAGLIEVALKKYVADRTDWRKMLRGEPPPCDLPAQRDALIERCQDEIGRIATTAGEGQVIPLLAEPARRFRFPVERYADKLVSHNLDKRPEVEGTLTGVKGQYLMFDTGVLNVRKFAGYRVTVEG